VDARFHPAQAVLARGDVEGLAKVLADDPALATARSQCSHPTILQCLVLTMPPVDTLETLIDLLASHGAELTDPLIAASGIDNTRAIAKLLDLGAKIAGNGRWSPLEEALYWGNSAAASLLLERGAPVVKLRTAAALGRMDLIARCFDGAGALTAMAGDVRSPFVKMPIPEAMARDPEQVLGNALVYAASWDRAESVQELLRRGARVNFIPAGFDYAGTALHHAALRGHRDAVDLLLRHGADPAVRDTKIGKLPEDWAAHDGHGELSEYLRIVRERAAEQSAPT
jgi:ankyrin repeat protein